MKPVFSFVLIVLFYTSIFCQTDKVNIVKHAGYNYYSISDKEYANVDSIRFIVSSPLNPKNPTIIFLQGSGNYPLIGYYADKDSIISFTLIPPFNIEKHKEKFNFLCISKPGTPVCVEWYNNKQLPLIDTTYKDYKIFNKMDFLDYYVSQTKQVVEYLNNSILEKESPIYIMGNSQGGRVATKYVYQNPNKTDKLILYASGVVDRHYEEILQWRQLADCGKVSNEEAQKNIDEIYKRYKNLRDYANSYKNETKSITDDLYKHNHFINDYSYNFDIPIDYLTKINTPILCVYGTNDLKSRNNDMLPLIFIRLNKNNLTMMPIMNCNHLFVEKRINTETNQEENVYIGNQVLDKVIKWINP